MDGIPISERRLCFLKGKGSVSRRPNTTFRDGVGIVPATPPSLGGVCGY